MPFSEYDVGAVMVPPGFLPIGHSTDVLAWVNPRTSSSTVMSGLATVDLRLRVPGPLTAVESMLSAWAIGRTPITPARSTLIAVWAPVRATLLSGGAVTDPMSLVTGTGGSGLTTKDSSGSKPVAAEAPATGAGAAVAVAGRANDVRTGNVATRAAVATRATRVKPVGPSVAKPSEIAFPPSSNFPLACEMYRLADIQARWTGNPRRRRRCRHQVAAAPRTLVRKSPPHRTFAPVPPMVAARC